MNSHAAWVITGLDSHSIRVSIQMGLRSASQNSTLSKDIEYAAHMVPIKVQVAQGTSLMQDDRNV